MMRLIFTFSALVTGVVLSFAAEALAATALLGVTALL